MWITVIDDERDRTQMRVGHNGKYFDVPIGIPFDADPEVIDVLTNSSVAFELTTEEGGLDGGVLISPPSETFSPFDHDRDGKVGGSLPKKLRGRKFKTSRKGDPK